MKRQTKPKAQQTKAKTKPTVEQLMLTSDQLVWAALKSMRDQGLLGIQQPKLAAIDAEIVRMGGKAPGIKTVSKSLKRLEKRGWIRRPLQLVAA